MREYVLFVILIFIPIGLVLYYFLRREGLPKKDIGIVLLLALLIIFSFPICMVRLGIYLSMLIYLLIIGALVVYLMRGGESPYLEMAFASLRNLRQRPELIISSEADFTDLKYEQLSEIPLEKAQLVVGQVPAETLREETIEIKPEDMEPAAALDMAGQAKVIPIDLEPAERISENAEEVTHASEVAADELVDEMVARLTAKIETMPETPAQARKTEFLAEEQAELAVVVENVKDVIAGAAVRVESVPAADLELTEDIAEESADQAEEVPDREIAQESADDEAETAEIPEPLAVEAETVDVIEEVEEIVDLELVEDIAEESADQAEEVPDREIAQESAADEAETAEITEPLAVATETVDVIEEVEEIVDLELVEDIVEESAGQAEEVPEQETVTESAADEAETVEIPEPLAVEAETVDVTEEVEEIAESVIVQEEIAIVAATDIEISEETLSETEDVKLEDFTADDMAESEAAQVIEEVAGLPATPSLLEDIEVLPEENADPEFSQALDGETISAEGDGEEAGPGGAADEAREEPAAEVEEATELSTATEADTQPVQLPAEDTLPETDITEAGEVSPDEAAEFMHGKAVFPLISADHAEVNRLVDGAFHYKTIGDTPAAIEAFVQVWNKVESDELRCLITLELVDLYKECGYYNYAEQVLGNYLELGGHKSDIIYEINRQLNAIRFLATELTRLGMSGAPWAQVPRWIRMELEDALNQ